MRAVAQFLRELGETSAAETVADLARARQRGESVHDDLEDDERDS
jgi:hypothetical protein